MKIHNYIVAFYILSSSVAYGHQDFWMVKTFDKVKVRIRTGFNYEEINKAWIIGEYTNILTKELNYNDTIFVDFNHAYTGNCIPDYFIAYDNGSIKDNGETYPFLKVKALVIREVSRSFNIATTLKLVEYAIANRAVIKLNQKSLAYNKNYFQWQISSIDTLTIRKLSATTSSALVTKVLQQKVLRPKTENTEDCVVSYFVKDNKYHVYFNSFETKKDTVVLVSDNIYQFQVLSYHEALLFTNDSTFYYVEGNYHPNSSKILVVQNNDNYYRPYKISKIAPYKITISFNVFNRKGGRVSKYRTLLFRCDVGDLIQDIDEAIDK